MGGRLLPTIPEPLDISRTDPPLAAPKISSCHPAPKGIIGKTDGAVKIPPHLAVVVSGPIIV